MNKIPADVMNAARDLARNAIKVHDADGWLEESATPIARAIMAGRERCAAYCDKIGYPDVAYDLRNRL